MPLLHDPRGIPMIYLSPFGLLLPCAEESGSAGLMGSAPGFEPGDPGSIPSLRVNLPTFPCQIKFAALNLVPRGKS